MSVRDNSFYSHIKDAEVAIRKRINAHPFIVGCRNGSVRREQLDRLLVQHALYGTHFTRYLTALMSNLRSGEECLQLAENLVEEFGLDSPDSVPHSRLFRQMLATLEIEPEGQRILPETQNLIETMYMQCRHSDPARGLGALCFGAEALVPDYYAALVEGFEHVGVPRDRLLFLTLHIECDDGHAETMRRILENLLADDPAALVAMTSAGETALDARLRLLDAMMEGEE